MFNLFKHIAKVKLQIRIAVSIIFSIIVFNVFTLYLIFFRNFNFFKIFDLKRIFEGTPGPLFGYYTELIVFFSLLLFLSIAIFVYRHFFVDNKVSRKFLKKIGKFLFSFSLWGFIWILLRWQGVYIFSSRAILYLIASIYFVRLTLLIYYYFFSYKNELENYNKNQIIKKYIPKIKNRKKIFMIVKKKTKIIATVGPATDSFKIIEEMAKNGVNVFRLNFSHDSHENHIKRIKIIRAVEKKIARPIAILVDLQGPKIRIGDLPGNSIELLRNKEIIFTVSRAQDNEVPVQYKKIINEIKIGDRILLDDGKLEVVTTKVKNPKIYTKIVNGGTLSSRKGMSFPDTEIACTVFTKKDKDDLIVALKNDVEYIAMSFVKSAKDIVEIRNFVQKYNKNIKIISKIERHEALKNIDELIIESDAIMVARGDLGIEITLDDVPLIQKDIIKKCISSAKPVIVATQMLESMIESSVPTRAEVSDIANAILDGADAVMLSAETSVGKYPVKAIKTMRDIAITTEGWAMNRHIFIGKSAKKLIDDTAEAIGKSACALVYDIGAKLIINATATGRTSRAVSNYRPYAPIVSITHDMKTARELQLIWGVYSRPVKYTSINDMIKKAIKAVTIGRIVKKGDRIIVITGHKAGIPGLIDTLQVKVL